MLLRTVTHMCFVSTPRWLSCTHAYLACCLSLLQAAESAIKALEAGDVAGLAAAEGTASAAHQRTNIAMEANTRSFKLEEQYKQQEAAREKQEAAAAADDDGAVAPAADAADAAGADADGQNGVVADEPPAAVAVAAGAPKADAGQKRKVDGAAEGAEGEGGGEGEGGAVVLTWQPSWARGGGGRGRDNGGRFRGIDPIYPMEDPQIIKVRVCVTQQELSVCIGLSTRLG